MIDFFGNSEKQMKKGEEISDEKYNQVFGKVENVINNCERFAKKEKFVCSNYDSR